MAYEVELSRELQSLSSHFDEWKQGKITSTELEALIHKFHSGAARDLFNKYNNVPLDMLLAHAIVTEMIDKDEIPDKLLQHLSNAIQFYESQMVDT
ncbi:MAG: hypothetical protein LDL41_05165 [Coleofasciculus sp. S288]|nr:hypothetical protein [Coleofasciculus sp. S288]